MKRIIPLLILLGIFPDIYVWAMYLDEMSTPFRWLHWLPSAVLLASVAWVNLVSYSKKLLRLFFFLVLCIGIPKVIFATFSCVGNLCGYAVIGDALGLTLSGIALLCFAYGLIWGWRHVVVKRTTIVSADLPDAFDGYRIAQITDIHAGSFAMSTETLRKMVRLANKNHPDVILFTGDLVNTSPYELDPFDNILSSLRAPDGVYSVPGNHDYCCYASRHNADSQLKSLRELIARQKMYGWRLLRNENVVIGRGDDEIAIIGVENEGKPPFPAYADLPKAMDGTERCAFRILMSHDPSHWHREILPESDIQLTLSGHTHAAQLKIGHFTPARFVYSEWGGLYKENDRFLYVSDGIGGTFPFRFGAWPTVEIITLKKKRSSGA
jgi:predicted MPP superfamily phosphohydrolase